LYYANPYSYNMAISTCRCFCPGKNNRQNYQRGDKKPVANASVFLNNAIVGDKTDDDGTFTLGNVKPGQYTFIVTAIGFETHSVTLMAGTANITLPEILLAPKTIMLQEVSIKPDPNRQRNYDDFKRLFLGTSANAAMCKILNPDVVDVDFNPTTRILSASAMMILSR
jgi:hypothetical protein